MNNKRLPIIILWIFSSLLTIFAFQGISLHLNSSIMNTIQDGIKNYYSVLYYVAFDEGNHFSGMHYPFGDHIIFSDNMPLFSLLIKYGNKILPGLDQYTLGFLHFLLLVSFPLAVHYLYLILRRFKVGIIFSIVSALFIAFFFPTNNQNLCTLWNGPGFLYPCNNLLCD